MKLRFQPRRALPAPAFTVLAVAGGPARHALAQSASDTVVDNGSNQTFNAPGGFTTGISPAPLRGG